MSKLQEQLKELFAEENTIPSSWEWFWDEWKKFKASRFSDKEWREKSLKKMQVFLISNPYSQTCKYADFLDKLKNAKMDAEGKIELNGNKSEKPIH